MQKENKNQLTSSRKVVIRDINTLLQTAPISRIKTLRDDEGRYRNVGQVLPDNKQNLITNNSCVVGPDKQLLRTPTLLNRAFTLIELLVVVLIIGILAAVALPQYQLAVHKARAMQVVTAVKSIAQAEEVFYLTQGHYTNSLSKLDITTTVPTGWKLTINTYNVIATTQIANAQLQIISYFLHAKEVVHKGKIYCWTAEENSKAGQVCRHLGTKKGMFNKDGYRWIL